ncbi:hypothetical protein AGR8A_pAt30059 [Agrobacterium fabrum str. J-07]|nr:hypothetical protein AGR8A_pAt30059 [Agrobacterium fabrum str. J-07]
MIYAHSDSTAIYRYGFTPHGIIKLHAHRTMEIQTRYTSSLSPIWLPAAFGAEQQTLLGPLRSFIPTIMFMLRSYLGKGRRWL